MNDQNPQARAWSCDTFYVGADATATGRALFGKNSDRPAGEAQPLRWNPRRDTPGQLRLAYVSIDDAPAFAHLGSAPHWCWGYEFAVNEHNVVIGNEALYTRPWAAHVQAARAGNPPAPGILGMELLRLGVERGRTAREALDVITELLERHGQWGSAMAAVKPENGAYDNAFVIADPTTAYVLETAGKDWAARQLPSDIFSISNEPTIRTDFDHASPALTRNLAKYRSARHEGSEFDFAETVVDPNTPLQVSHIRQRRSEQLLTYARDNSGVSVEAAKKLLRDHYEGTFLGGPFLNAARPDFHTLCMHEHPAGFTWGNTASSIIIDLAATDDDITVIWWTPLPPCLGAYIPIVLQSAAVPPQFTLPAPLTPRPPEDMHHAIFDPQSYWWTMQNLLDITKGDELGTHFTKRSAEIRSQFDPLEQTWTQQVDTLRHKWSHADSDGRAHIVDQFTTLTKTAAHAVRNIITTTIELHAPEHHHTAYDTRWRSH